MAANLDRHLNLIDATTGMAWHFNPFAWQFLFAIGAVLALAMRAGGGTLPRRTWLVALCWCYLGMAFVAAAPWTAWGLPDLRPLRLATPDKTTLSPLSLLDVLALGYLVLGSRWLSGFVRLPVFAVLEACGKHSLEVFSLGTLLSLIGQLVMQTFGTELPMQILVNVFGLSSLLLLGTLLDRNARAVSGRQGRTPVRPAFHLLPPRHSHSRTTSRHA